MIQERYTDEEIKASVDRVLGSDEPYSDDDIQASLDRVLGPKESLGLVGGAIEHGKAFASGALKTAGAAGVNLGKISDQLPDALKLGMGIPGIIDAFTDQDESTFTQAGRAVSGAAPDVDPYVEDSLTGKIASGLGSTGVFLGTAAIPGLGVAGRVASAAGTGMLVEGGAAYETALARGATEDEAVAAMFATMPAGALEAVTAAPWGGRVAKVLARASRAAPQGLRGLFVGGLGEGATEWTQSGWGEAVAQGIYGEEDYKAVLEAANSSFFPALITGGLVEGAVQWAEGRYGAKQELDAAPIEPETVELGEEDERIANDFARSAGLEMAQVETPDPMATRTWEEVNAEIAEAQKPAMSDEEAEFGPLHREVRNKEELDQALADAGVDAEGRSVPRGTVEAPESVPSPASPPTADAAPAPTETTETPSGTGPKIGRIVPAPLRVQKLLGLFGVRALAVKGPSRLTKNGAFYEAGSDSKHRGTIVLDGSMSEQEQVAVAIGHELAHVYEMVSRNTEKGTKGAKKAPKRKGAREENLVAIGGPKELVAALDKLYGQARTSKILQGLESDYRAELESLPRYQGAAGKKALEAVLDEEARVARVQEFGGAFADLLDRPKLIAELFKDAGIARGLVDATRRLARMMGRKTGEVWAEEQARRAEAWANEIGLRKDITPAEALAGAKIVHTAFRKMMASKAERLTPIAAYTERPVAKEMREREGREAREHGEMPTAQGTRPEMESGKPETFRQVLIGATVRVAGQEGRVIETTGSKQRQTARVMLEDGDIVDVPMLKERMEVIKDAPRGAQARRQLTEKEQARRAQATKERAEGAEPRFSLRRDAPDVVFDSELLRIAQSDTRSVRADIANDLALDSQGVILGRPRALDARIEHAGAQLGESAETEPAESLSSIRRPQAESMRRKAEQAIRSEEQPHYATRSGGRVTRALRVAAERAYTPQYIPNAQSERVARENFPPERVDRILRGEEERPTDPIESAAFQIAASDRTDNLLLAMWRNKTEESALKAQDIAVREFGVRSMAGRDLQAVKGPKDPQTAFVRAAATPTQRGRVKLARLHRQLAKARTREQKADIQKKIDEVRDLEARYSLRGRQHLEELGIDPLEIDDVPTLRNALREFNSKRGSLYDWLIQFQISNLVSGPATLLVVNPGTTFANGLYNTFLRRGAQALIPLEGSPQFGEFAAMFKAMPAALDAAFKNSWEAFKTESSVLQPKIEGNVDSLGGQEGLEGRSTRIPGKLGRAIRLYGLTPLQVADEFNFTMSAYLEAAALAHRYSGGDVAEMERQLADFGSPAWNEASERAQRYGFRDRDPDTLTGRVTNALLLGRSQLDALTSPLRLGTQAFKFVGTPTNVFGQAIRLPGAPLIAMSNFVRGEWSDKGKRAEDLADTLLAAGMIAGLAALVGAHDDDGIPYITGSSPTDWRGRRIEENVAPPNSVRIGGKWNSFSRWDPFATAISLAVDTIQGWRRGDAAMSAFESLLNQTKDKTFTRTIGDIISIVQSPESGKAAKIARTMTVDTLAPNWLRTAINAPDPYVRADMTREWSQMLSGFAAKFDPESQPLIYDYFGRPVEKVGSNTIERTFGGLPEVHVDADRADKAMFNWNEAHPDNRILPTPPSRDIDDDTEFEPHEYAELVRVAGEMAFAKIRRLRFDERNPTEKQIEAFRREFSDANRTARARAIGKRR